MSFLLSDDVCNYLGDTADMEGCAWLKEIEKPENFVVVGAMYGGPHIVEN